MDSFAQSELQNDRSKDGLPRGKLLAAIAIPIGLVIGNVIGYFLIPAGWYWLTTLCVTVGVGILHLLL